MRQWILWSLLLLTCPMSWGDTQGWSGHWEFAECWSPLSNEETDCVIYVMDIQEDKNRYIVNIALDGFQTLERIEAEAHVSGQSLIIIFSRLKPGYFGSKYKPGDILLKLRGSSNKPVTEWGKIQPILKENKEPDVHFTRE